jgi:hypothetical protein
MWISETFPIKVEVRLVLSLKGGTRVSPSPQPLRDVETVAPLFSFVFSSAKGQRSKVSNQGLDTKRVEFGISLVVG